MADINITNLPDRPYDNYLFRSDQPDTNGNVETQPVKTEGSLNDIWIDTFMKSTDWAPKTRGFYVDGKTGYAEFANVFITGGITATTGSIGGWVINPTNLTSPLGQVVLDSANNKIIFYNNLGTKTITLDGSLTLAGEPQIRVGGGIYVYATEDSSQLAGGRLVSLGAGVGTVALEALDFSGNTGGSFLVGSTGYVIFNNSSGTLWEIDTYGDLEIPSVHFKTPDTIGAGFSSDFTPDYTNSRNLGTNSKYWDNAYINGTISIRGSIIPDASLVSHIGSIDYLLGEIFTYNLEVYDAIIPIQTPEGKTIIGVPDVLGAGPDTFQTVATHTVSFTGDSSDPSLNINSVNYTYPDGALYYNTVSQKIRLKKGGIWTDLVTGGSTWTSDVNAAGYSLTNGGNINAVNFISTTGSVYALNYYCNGTQVMDSGRNMSNLSNVTANNFTTYSGYVYASSFLISGTPVIDGSRNITNINNITATGQALFSNESSGCLVNWLKITGSAPQIGTSGSRFDHIYGVRVHGNYAFIVDSDIRLKKNISVSTYGLKEINKLQPIKYELKDENYKGVHLGFSAQDVKRIIPEIVTTVENDEKDTEETEDEKMLGIYSTGIIPILVRAVQELSKEIEILKSQLAKKP